MKIKNQELFETFVRENSGDDYGREILEFSERWALLMEMELAQGKSIEQMADLCARDADTNGISGFMYGCAVDFLSKVREHGEELRIWHNLDSQIGNEGETANREGGVLNPSLISISQ